MDAVLGVSRAAEADEPGDAGRRQMESLSELRKLQLHLQEKSSARHRPATVTVSVSRNQYDFSFQKAAPAQREGTEEQDSTNHYSHAQAFATAEIAHGPASAFQQSEPPSQNQQPLETLRAGGYDGCLEKTELKGPQNIPFRQSLQ